MPSFNVIYDPIRAAVGGLRPGTILPQDEVSAMLQNEVFAEGTILRHDPSGQEFVVKYDNDYWLSHVWRDNQIVDR